MEFFENLDKKKVEVPFFIGELTTLVFGATEIVSFVALFLRVRCALCEE